MNKFKFWYNKLLRSDGLYSFLSYSPPNARILDVGCGNDSSFNIKKRFPKFNYTGIDVCDYNISKPIIADQYLLVSSEEFSEAIASMANTYDVVVSSHNLEHCDNPNATLKAMLKAVKPGGSLYLAFPCEQSVMFPSRKRTLNYFDDPTHKGMPPNFDDILCYLNDHGFIVKKSIRRYRPKLLWLIGLIQEPLVRILNEPLQGTWAFYGFESIIWAKKSYTTLLDSEK